MYLKNVRFFNIRFLEYAEYFLALAVSLVFSTLLAFAFTLLREPNGLSDIMIWENFVGGFPIALFAGFVNFSILIIFYHVALRGISMHIKILMTLVAVPIFSLAMIIFGEAIILTVHKELNIMLLNLVILASIYLAAIFIILFLSGALSSVIRNIIIISYGSFLGAFFGMALPLAVVMTSCIFTSIFDALAINVLFKKEMKDFIDKMSASKIYVSKLIEVGLGDFIFISIIPAMVFYRFGIWVSLFSSVLIFIGWIVNLVLVLRKNLIASLPIPVMLGLVPPIVLLISYAL